MTAVIQLPLLQGLIRKDPISYREEFQLQKHHYQAQMDLLQLKPTQENDQLLELLDFISHTISCYPEEATAFIEQLMTILEQSCSLLSPPIRLKIFQSVVTVRNKINYNSIELLKLSFKLLGMNDKVFRAYVTQFIFNDIKTITVSKTNMAMYRSIQSFLHKFISEETSLIAQKSIHILSELYRKRIWTDSKTVNIIASALYNNNTSVFMSAIHFFLGIDTKMLEDEEEEKDKVKKVRDSMNLHEHSKKTRKRLRQVEKQKVKISKLQKQLSEKANSQITTTKPLLPAILMIDNPFNVSEVLFKKLKSSSASILNFENKLLLMNFLSQLIGCHKLILLPFYSYLQKYITAHQQNITNVFVYLIQSVHEFIPPMDLLPIIKNIAFHFITERSTEENITLGINTIREILTRNPSILLEEDLKDFIQDLTFYTHKHKKCVVSAARSLINFVREEYPSLLHKSDRGKGTDLKKVPLGFGQEKVLDSREILNFGDNDDEEEEDDEGDEEEDGEEGEWEEVEDSDGENEEDEGEWEEMEEEEEGSNKGDDDEDEWESVDEDEEEEEEEADDDEENESAGKKGSKKSVSFAGDENSESIGTVSKKSKGSKSIRRRLDVNRVLNDSDLQLFEHLKALRQGTLKRSRSDEDDEDSDEESEEEYDDDDDDDNRRHLPEFMVDPSSILPSSRAGKSTKIDRIKNILSGRSDKKFEHEGHAGGLTNKEKLRKKNYMMVRKGKREVLQKYRRGSADTRAAKATQVNLFLHSIFFFRSNHGCLSQKEVWGRDRRKKRRI